MKFLHTSDLHFGKRLDNVSFIDDQMYILNQIFDIIHKNSIDAILIAGDIYDRSIPSIEATKLLNDTLEKLSNLKLPIYIVSGNHDSAERLSFGSSIFRKDNIYICGCYDGTIQMETLFDDLGEVNIYLMPYINTINVKLAHQVEVNSLTDAFKMVVDNANVDTSKRNILIAHQFAMQSNEEISSFEEYIGGTQNIDASIFADTFDYTALGHIHKPYWVIKNKVRYCGSPLKYSTNECNQRKSVTIIDFKDKGNISFEEVELIPKHDLRCIRGNLQDILDNAINITDYVDVTLTDEDYLVNAMDKLRSVYPNVLRLSFDNSRTQSIEISKTSANDVEDKSTLELFKDFYQDIYGQSLDDNLDYLEILKEVSKDVEQEEVLI